MKVDKNFDYEANGYKFLGWQNGWEHVHVDKDGNITDDPQKYYLMKYTKDKYPEYAACIEQKHPLTEIRMNYSGTENIVSCPICKIYWKYDSSD